MESSFKLGQLVATRGVHQLARENGSFNTFIMQALCRHASEDWGEMCKDDKEANNKALLSGDARLFSAYIRQDYPKIWIITEADRSVTTILFPDEY